MTQKQSTAVAAVTGATGAIGKAIALGLAQHNFQVVLISRSESKCQQAVSELKELSNNQAITYQLADLGVQGSIADLFARWEGPCSVLVNNAAIAPPAREETPDGIERQFATNVLGYFWMSEYFKQLLTRSAPARIVNVASYWAGGLDLTDLEFRKRSYNNHAAYRQSKQANRMLTPVLAEKYQPLGINVNSCHPGDVNSTLSNDLGFGGSQSPSQGASTPVWLAADPSLNGVTGKYFERQQETTCQFASHKEAADELFRICRSYTR